jgi:hypothetical protein
MNEENKKAPIDLVAIFNKLWPHRKKYYKILPAVLVGSYLIMCLIPRYYSCSVSLAPESSSAMAGGSLGSLASSFGFGSLAKLGGEDAISAEIYPVILASNDFIAKLMPVEVQTQDGKVKANYFDYNLKHQKSSPWGFVIGWTRSKISSIGKKKPAGKGSAEIDIFNLTEMQSDVFESVKGKIKCVVDKKTGVITIIVQDQDPLICASMARETCKKLQEFIVEYRTNKARVDYEYYKKLCGEAKHEYERLRQLYGSYSDSNMDVVLTSYKSKIEDLENEMQIKYNVYSTMSTQMQMAQAKLQEATPAFTVLQGASVPVRPAGPKRLIIAVAMTMLAFFGITGKILFNSRKAQIEK